MIEYVIIISDFEQLTVIPTNELINELFWISFVIQWAFMSLQL